MSLASFPGIIQTAFELGLISSLTVLALFLSYSMLNVCDLSTDGCFTLGAAVGAVVAIAGRGRGGDSRASALVHTRGYARRSPVRFRHRFFADEDGN